MAGLLPANSCRASTSLRETRKPAGTDSLFVPGMRSLNCEKHVIFYQRLDAAKGAPVVLRIADQRRYLPALVYYDDLDVA